MASNANVTPVNVSIKKISGEVHTFTADVGETVGELKVRLADQLSAPVMCQRWLLETPSAANEHLLRCIFTRMEHLVSSIERPQLNELMAIHRPPEILEACFDVVIELVSSKESGLEEEIKRLRRCKDDKWRAMTAIVSGKANQFMRALESFPDDVSNERIRLPAVKSAQEKMQELGNKLLPARMRRVSSVGEILSSWAKLALKYFDIRRGFCGMLELEDCIHLAGCQGEGEELCLSLVVDLEPAISHLSFSIQLEKELEAVAALKVVGHSDPERSIRLLAPRIFDGDLGPAAAEAAGAICKRNEGSEMPELLMKELQDFLDAGLRRPFRALIEVLDQVVPQGNLKVCEWMVLILQKGVQEEQEIALARVRDLQQNWDRSAAVDLILDRLFSLKDPRKWNDTCESGEEFLMKALAGVCKQEIDMVRGTLMEMLKDEDSRKVARAARTVAAVGADEELLQAVLATLEVETTKGTTWAVLEICISLDKISPNTKKQVCEALLRELRLKRLRNCEEVLVAIYQCLPLDGVLEFLRSYLKLKHANRIRKEEGVKPLLEAAEIAEFYIKTSNSPEAKELKSVVKTALAQGVADGDKKCSEVLPKIVDFEGEGEEVLQSLVNGLSHPSQKVRALCQEVFLQVVPPDDPRAAMVLIRNIEQEIVTSTRCSQIELLADVAPRNQTEVVDLLLRLAEENDVSIRSTALAQLWACADGVQCLGPLRAHLAEKDEQVRLACLSSMLKLEEDLPALQELCLQNLTDDASSIVLLTLETLNDRCDALAKEEDWCQSLQPLLSHGDAAVRQAACKVFGKMKQEGRTTAERLLEGEGLRSWPEKNAAVLEERRKTLSILRGDFLDKGDDEY